VGFGGVSVCTTNEVASAISGTLNPTTGGSSFALADRWTLYTGPTVANPCPRCVAGSCDSGQRMGMSCTVNGTSTVFFDDTSFDCPPSGGTKVGADYPSATVTSLVLSAGVQSRTLSAANPFCTATGYTTTHCFCDTCNGAGQQPCGTNADCPPSGGNPGI